MPRRESRANPQLWSVDGLCFFHFFQSKRLGRRRQLRRCEGAALCKRKSPLASSDARKKNASYADRPYYTHARRASTLIPRLRRRREKKMERDEEADEKEKKEKEEEKKQAENNATT